MATVQLDITEYNDLKLSYAALKQKIKSEIEEEIHLSYRTDLEQFRKVANEANENFLKAMGEVERLEQTLIDNEVEITSFCKTITKLQNSLNDEEIEVTRLKGVNTFLSKSYQEIKVKLENTVSKSTFEKVESAFIFQREYTDKLEIELNQLKKSPLIVKLEEAELKVSELKAYKQLYEEAIKPKSFIQKFKQLFQ